MFLSNNVDTLVFLEGRQSPVLRDFIQMPVHSLILFCSSFLRAQNSVLSQLTVATRIIVLFL